MASDKRTFDATETEEGKNKKLKTAEKIENNASEVNSGVVVKKQDTFGEKQVQDSKVLVKKEDDFGEKQVQDSEVLVKKEDDFGEKQVQDSEVLVKKEDDFGEKQVQDSEMLVKKEDDFGEKHVQGGGEQIPLAGAELEEVTDTASSPFLHLRSRSFLRWESAPPTMQPAQKATSSLSPTAGSQGTGVLGY